MSLTSILRDIITHPITEDVASLVPGVSTAVKVNDLVKKAKKGDRDAQTRLSAIRKLADQGDPKAQAVVAQAKAVAAQTPAKKSYYDIGVTVGHDPYEFVGAVVRDHTQNIDPNTGKPKGPAPGQPGSGFRMEGRRLVPCNQKVRDMLAAQNKSARRVPGLVDKRTIKPGTGPATWEGALAASAAYQAARLGPQVTPGFGPLYDSQGNYLGTTDPSTRGQITLDEATGQAYDPSTGTTFDPNTGQVIRQPGGQAPTPPGMVDPMTGLPYPQPGVDPYTGLPVPGGLSFPGGPGYDPYGGGYGANPFGLPYGYGLPPTGPQAPYDPYGLLGYLSQMGMGDGPVCAPRRQVYDPDTDRFYSSDVKMKYDADTNTFAPVSCYNPYTALEEAYGYNQYGYPYQVSGWAYNKPYRTNFEALVQRSPGLGAGAREMYNRGLGQSPTLARRYL